MIVSFSNKETEKLWEKKHSKQFVNIARVALRKLTALDAAEELIQLTVPPGNQLEALKGKETGWHSISINDQ